MSKSTRRKEVMVRKSKIMGNPHLGRSSSVDDKAVTFTFDELLDIVKFDLNVGAPAGTRFLPLVFEVHGGCTGDTAREIRHLLNAWSEQNGYDETRCAVNRHAWRYYIACMLAHAVQAQVRWLAEPMAASG